MFILAELNKLIHNLFNKQTHVIVKCIGHNIIFLIKKKTKTKTKKNPYYCVQIGTNLYISWNNHKLPHPFTSSLGDIANPEQVFVIVEMEAISCTCFDSWFRFVLQAHLCVGCRILMAMPAHMGFSANVYL